MDNTIYIYYILTMGQTKRLYAEMEMDELLTHFFNHTDGDDDYQYQEYRNKKMEAEQEAYELHFQDKYVNG